MVDIEKQLFRQNLNFVENRRKRIINRNLDKLYGIGKWNYEMLFELGERLIICGGKITRLSIDGELLVDFYEPELVECDGNYTVTMKFKEYQFVLGVDEEDDE